MITCDKCKKESEYLNRTVKKGLIDKIWACQKCMKEHYPDLYVEDAVTQELANILNNK